MHPLVIFPSSCNLKGAPILRGCRPAELPRISGEVFRDRSFFQSAEYREDRRPSFSSTFPLQKLSPFLLCSVQIIACQTDSASVSNPF
ncbi:hypothetical protein ZOSMA_87G00250 [Zostera marina]|uniref:Uncharacterized protein n=1 Tax=Zostera marina TaxID=29655 RepID=A0A0K9NKY9_ZOSMR|nr:hypothetical protein ZOSMA_87G00250 [Zostera marina]